DAIYIAGSFSTASGQMRRGVAAVSKTVGTPTTWNAGLNGDATSVAVEDDTVVVAGALTAAKGSTTRTRLAAFERHGTGNLLPWSPSLGYAVGMPGGGAVAI